jgi:hypothetical protein
MRESDGGQGRGDSLARLLRVNRERVDQRCGEGHRLTGARDSHVSFFLNSQIYYKVNLVKVCVVDALS